MDRSLELFVNQISNARVYTFADPSRGASTANPLLYKIFPTGGYDTTTTVDHLAEGDSGEEIGEVPSLEVREFDAPTVVDDKKFDIHNMLNQ